MSIQRIPKGEQWDGEDPRRFLSRNNLSVTFHLPIGDSSQGAELCVRTVRQMARRIAGWDGGSGLVEVVGYDPAWNGSPDRYDEETTFRALLRAVDELSESGIRVALENWLGNTDMAALRSLAAAVPEAGLLVDAGHLLIAQRSGLTSGLSVEEYLRRVPLPIFEVHLHDNDGTQDTHSPLGTGVLNLSQLCSGLVERGFRGIVTIEHGGPLCEQTLSQILSSRRAFLEACP